MNTSVGERERTKEGRERRERERETVCHTVPKLKSITVKRKKCGTQFMNVCFRLKNFNF